MSRERVDRHGKPFEANFYRLVIQFCNNIARSFAMLNSLLRCRWYCWRYQRHSWLLHTTCKPMMMMPLQYFGSLKKSKFPFSVLLFTGVCWNKVSQLLRCKLILSRPSLSLSLFIHFLFLKTSFWPLVIFGNLLSLTLSPSTHYHPTSAL